MEQILQRRNFNAKVVDLGTIAGVTPIMVFHNRTYYATLSEPITLSFTNTPPVGKQYNFSLRFTNVENITWPEGTLAVKNSLVDLVGPIYEITCSLNSSGIITVYGVLDAIELLV